MEERPPVPPKDAKYAARMAKETSTAALNSGSKRKREGDNDNLYSVNNNYADASDYDEHTPKRSRPRLQPSDLSASEDNTVTQPRLVRKRGSRNLSNLNLRHAAKNQTLALRESKFQEGSLNDKPSEKPPSFFTRMTRTENRNPGHVDTLMEDYHTDMPAAPESADFRGNTFLQTATSFGPVAAKKDESKGFFQFGRQVASTFHPVTLWKSIWGQAKDEVAKEEFDEQLALKMQLKKDADAKYAEMKRTGQFELQLVGPTTHGARSSADEASTPQDSAVAFDSLQSSVEGSRNTSAATVLMQPAEIEGEELAKTSTENSNQLPKGLKDRLHLKKPSLSNLQNGLRRMTSDINLTGNRESSSSISPIKNDFGFSTTLKDSASKLDLRKSASRYDLKKSASKVDLKKQHKLSKRVSDLESKLTQARKELDEALVEASPVPILSGKYERFTPSATVSRPKFVPGKLPSLSSERILMAEQGVGVNDNDEVPDHEHSTRSKGVSHQEKAVSKAEEDGEDTIKASRARSYPTRATSLFEINDSNDGTHSQAPANDKSNNNDLSEANHVQIEDAENMDPNSIIETASEATPQTTKVVDYASLDAKLKALDANVKNARKAPKTKKRKSGGDDEDKAFKPTKMSSDDDAEWEEATPRKKSRKATDGKNEASPPNKRATNGGTKSSPTRKGKSDAAQTNGVKSSPTKKKAVKEVAVVEISGDDDAQAEEQFSEEELTGGDDFRASVNSQASLDPVLEEEEEAQAGAEDQLMTRAAKAVKDHPARQNGARSPPPKTLMTRTTVEEETVTVVSGEDGVPGLPRGANGSFESLDVFGGAATEVEVLRATNTEMREEFEWPDDVF